MQGTGITNIIPLRYHYLQAGTSEFQGHQEPASHNFLLQDSHSIKIQHVKNTHHHEIRPDNTENKTANILDNVSNVKKPF